MQYILLITKIINLASISAVDYLSPLIVCILAAGKRLPVSVEGMFVYNLSNTIENPMFYQNYFLLATHIFENTSVMEFIVNV